MESKYICCNIYAVLFRMDILLYTMYEIVCKMLYYYYYNIVRVQQLQPTDPTQREALVLQILANGV